MTTAKQLRAKLGISQPEMARLLGTLPHRISEFENGKRNETKQLQAYLAFIEYAGSEVVKKYLEEIKCKHT